MLSSIRIHNITIMGMLFLIGLAAPTRADEKGDLLVRQVMKQIADTEPLVCDYSVTYRYHDALQVYKCQAQVAHTKSGLSSERIREEGVFPSHPQDALFRTIDFLPLLSAYTRELETSAIRTRYVGAEVVQGISYTVVEVTLPVQETIGPQPIKQVILRWFVGADNLIHRITGRVNTKDLNIPQPRKTKAASLLRDLPKNPAPTGKPPATTLDNTAGGDQAKVSPASEDAITIEAVVLDLHQALSFPPRPLTNPPLPPRAGLGPATPIHAATLSPNGALLAKCAEATSKIIHVFDAHTGELQQTLDGSQSPVGLLQFSADGRLLASGSQEDTTVLLWDVPTGRRLQTLNAGGNVSNLIFSPDGTRLAVAVNSGTIALWDTTTGAQTQVLKQHNASCFAFAPDGRRLISLEYPQTVLLWDIESGKTIRNLSVPFGSMTAPAFSPDGKYFAVAKRLTALKETVLNSKDQDRAKSAKNPGQAQNENNALNNRVVICDGQTGEPLRELQGTLGTITALAFLDGGKTLLALDLDERGDIPTNHPGLVMWNTNTWQQTEARELAEARYNGFNVPVVAPVARRILLLDTGVSGNIWDLAETLPPASPSKP